MTQETSYTTVPGARGKSVRRRVTGLAAILCCAAGVGVATAPEAAADECHDVPGVGLMCGQLWNTGNVAIGVINTWTDEIDRTPTVDHHQGLLAPGDHSYKYRRDVDGFWVGKGYCAREHSPYTGDYFYRGPINVQIHDTKIGAEYTVSARPC
ncbi:hypothetical protein [Amycolatopsis sp. NPDC059021]|uniref:hypothetical protein n=1 Tax=Amycolatopsis sp. NPDC059021 TaxID=3346704 RepID=UPI00367341AD